MGVPEILAMIGTGAASSLITAWAMLRGKQVDTLHLSEVEFRKALLVRIEQLEKRAKEDGEEIEALKAENRTLRDKIAVLERQT